MNLIHEPVIFDFENDVYSDQVVVSSKYFKDIKQIYQNPENMKNDTEMYHVYSYDAGENVAGNLRWGMTVLNPVYVNGECNMTRGHWHQKRECAELYYGVAGEGLLMLMDETGNTWTERVFKGSVHHIDGHLAHRLLNTSDTVLKVIACWGCDAGHDYAAVEKQPFGYRVMKDKEKILFIKEKDDEK